MSQAPVAYRAEPIGPNAAPKPCGGNCGKPALPDTHPKAKLAKLLTDGKTVAWARAAAEDSPALFAQLLFLRAGLGSPPGESVAELVTSLTRTGWRVIPATLDPPTAGDLYVVTDDRMALVDLGLVGAVNQDASFFQSVHVTNTGDRPGRRYDLKRADADTSPLPPHPAFWLRLPGG